MLRSLMTAVTGVRAHQTMLDVTGNNIANANTTGFKKDNTVFQDLMYQTQKYASGPGDGRGGINPAQVGLGVSVGAIETIYTQGAANYTGNPSDMMIQGSGFFVLDSGTGSQLYTRAGANVRDANNDLVQSGTGYKVQGYAMEEDPLTPGSYTRASDLSAINIPLGKKLPAKDTTEVKFQCNLNSESDAYLPYGYADIPFNTECGWDGNKAGTIRVDLAGYDCDISVKSLTKVQTTAVGTNDSPPDAAKDGTNYLSVTVDDGLGKPRNIVFNMTEIKDGLPVLTVAIPAGTPATETAPAVPGTIHIGPEGEGKGKNLTVEYEDGLLKLKDGSETVYQSNLFSAMNYKSFTLTNKSVTPNTSYPMLLEFDESVVTEGDPSDLAGTYADATIWYQAKTTTGEGEEATTTITINKLQSRVYFKADGTFDYADDINQFPEGETHDLANFPDGYGAETLKLAASEDGRSLIIQQDKNPASPTGKFDDVAQVSQGGFHQTKQTIYDCDGHAYTMEVNYKKITTNRWRWEAFILNDDGTMSDIIPKPHAGEIEFCGCGPICNAVTSEGNATRHGNNDNSNARAEIEIPFSMVGSKNTTLTLNFGGDGDDMMGVTQFASETTTKAVYQNGYTMGILEDYSIAVDGTITGNYSNGQRIPLYRVAIATFANEQGLEKVGSTEFRATTNSGNANIDPAGVNGKGSIMSQNTEMSNVDLTKEFTHLIIAQRGFQANTRVITTSDQVLEEVVNLKR